MKKHLQLLQSLQKLVLPKTPGTKPYDPHDDWSINPFPDGRSFGFTLVHDADDAYSARLAPLFDAFDELGFKITATAFAFWADWAADGNVWREWKNAEPNGSLFFAPKAVPLLDAKEQQFYMTLAARGHEVGLHTPSDTSSPRDDVVRAFEFYQKIFGRYPPVYVEHRVSVKKDAQANEGSSSNSIYYNTDLLNLYGPWVWIDDPWGVPHRHPQFYDILAANGSPFHRRAAQKYGIQKAFLRTGKWRQGDGDGFQSWYSQENIDSLEKNRGLALVYTHLDKKWLDPETGKMRPEIKNRLEYLASKNGWFVPAGKMLDRMRTMQQVKLYHDRNFLKVANMNAETIEGLTLISNRMRSLSHRQVVFNPDAHRNIVVGRIRPGETIPFDIV